MKTTQRRDAVAIIGAGPAGLVAARWLIQAGLEPVLFEAAGSPGGQWNPDGPASATWPGMRTNTSRTMSRFSDLDHSVGTPCFPRREDMQNYLQAYAERFELHRRMRLNTRVEQIERSSGGWKIGSCGPEGEQIERFAKVILATGAEGTPVLPEIAGLERFTGTFGALHSAHYAGVERYRGRSVLVAGCSISALEIASELALGGAAQVVTSYRRQRYVLPKIVAGIPTDNLMFTRAAALAGAVLPPHRLAEQMLDTVTKAGGRPEQFGAPAADPDIFAAGVTQAQHFLPAVADGRITIRPWIDCIDDRTVRFVDGSELQPDCIIFGTGYRPSLPSLPVAIRNTLELEAGGPDLFEHTLHPDLPDMAFLGLYNLVGPKLPVLELQARWIAQLFSNQCAAPTSEQMRQGALDSRAKRRQGVQPAMNVLALAFARKAGVEPDPGRWPDLERALLFGPLVPASFRLEGPDALPGAAQQQVADAAAFGASAIGELTPEETTLLELLRQSRQPREAA
ncbi:flavin-containing monooxygenase [Altericroceibacterium xinjiangense]|uniref:flavin-containing monooxygenase n=1 Tax=Altericroceibacterium xinjiangense TaxID=762261 RepID=UPI000F7F5693|nr:FAD-dependent oxidoreductase [Altericroceibacterium xinjiangense]